MDPVIKSRRAAAMTKASGLIGCGKFGEIQLGKTTEKRAVRDYWLLLFILWILHHTPTELRKSPGSSLYPGI